MHRATSKFLCLFRHSHAPATSETIKKSVEYKTIAMQYFACYEKVQNVENIFVHSFSFTIR